MAVMLAVTSAVLLWTIVEMGGAGTAARHTKVVLISAGRLQGLVLDLEADSHALARTGDQTFQRRYDAARSAFDAEGPALERAVLREDEDQAASARRLVQAGDAYVHDYVVPLMTAARDDPPSARSAVAAGTGAQSLASLRDQGVAFENTQRLMVAAAERRFAVHVRQAITAAVTMAVLALLLIVFFATYVTKVIVGPVRRVALMAGDQDDGDAGATTRERSPGEIGMLETGFNTMLASLAASEEKLRQVAAMQGALRRVATLVACGVSASEVFAAVAAEAGKVLAADHTVIVRFEHETADVVAYWNDPRVPQVMPPLDGHWPIESGTVTATVRSTERPARMSDYERNTSAIGCWARAKGLRHVVGCPVKVEGRVWGAMIMHSLHSEPTRGATENRMQEFVELLGTAIANAQSRSDLLASRARVVAAADESRRRIERDLHDGAQQRLVTLALKLRTFQSASDGPGQTPFRQQLGGLVHDLSEILDDLQEVARGIIPPILRRSGLPPALRSLARRSPVPVLLHMGDVECRLPERVEVAVYYTVAEALTNVVKHGHASEVNVDLALRDETVRLSVRDDGCGGACLSGGTGLVGLKDRVEALNGRIEVRSPLGEGTTLLVEIPLQPVTEVGPAGLW
jgi:signal transduction histidine kinase